MVLGNSGGGNKGKKYLKIKGNEVITPENQNKADSFKIWFGSMYKTLQKELISKDTYDEDVLNDTFLRLHDKILYGGLVIADYKAYFHRAFFTNYIQHAINKNKLSEKIIEFDYSTDVIDESEDNIKIEIQEILLSSDVMDYVSRKYPKAQFELFKMYVSLKPCINYSELSNITSLSTSRISEIISTIRRDILTKEEFIKRRKKM